jgi:type II secretory pathway pseudopilin PulG
VEMLAALAFLGILMPVLISALLVSSRAGGVAERRTVAMQLGENKINELMIDNAWTSADSRGDFGDTRPGYRWELKKDSSWENGEMTELTINVFFKIQGQENDITLTTLVNEELTTQ